MSDESDDEPSAKRMKAKGSKGGSSCHQVRFQRMPRDATIDYVLVLVPTRIKKSVLD